MVPSKKFMQTVLITGASGFLGRACCAAFTSAGYSVHALVRNADAHQDLQPIARGGIYTANLPDYIDEAAFYGVQAVIHCAYTTTGSDQKITHETNLTGTRRLRELSQQHGVPQFIFISSLAAHAGARSAYGITKWQLEQEMTAPSDTIVKPATIIGPGGIFERTREMIRKLPIVPVLYGNRQLQTIDIADACTGLIEIVRRGISGTVILAHPETVSMQEFYRKIAAIESPRKILIPVSGDLALLAVTALENLGLQLPISSENLLGIKHLHHFDPLPEIQRLGLTPRSFQQSLDLLTARSAD
jgi:nucleoside-diphosphate-sugar epimerase